MVKRQMFNIQVSTVTASGYIIVDDKCNALTFTNTGADIVTVNGMILYPGTPGTILGDSRSIGGNENEIYKGNIKVAFTTVVNPQLEVVQKIYVDPQ